jgi:glycosyltransferase involved in cell wall biosynthesis
MESTTPLVSVCIPSYCGGPYIGAAIESVLNQTFTDFELIVIDDHSSDDTCEVVARYKDPRLRLVRSDKNIGAEGNWNRCLGEARGVYVKILPQDDLIRSDCLEKQVSVLKTDRASSLSFVFAARDIVSSEGRTIMRRGYPTRKTGSVDARSLTRATARAGGNLIGEPGSVLFRRSSIDKVGVFDGSIPYVIDLDYWVRLLSVGDAYYIAESLSSFRVSKISWSVAIGRRQRRQFSDFIERISHNPIVRLSTWDKTVGKLMSARNTLARRILYLKFAQPAK